MSASIVSLPEPPIRISAPLLPVMWSLPGPPQMMSGPLFPMIVSLPLRATITSLCLVPTIRSWCWVPTIVALWPKHSSALCGLADVPAAGGTTMAGRSATAAAAAFLVNPSHSLCFGTRARTRSARTLDACRFRGSDAYTGRREGLCDRCRLLGDLLVPGAERARDRVRLLREGLGGRRQLALHERQRDVLGLPLAAHQHLARADGLLDLPDARRLPGLPEPLPDRQVLRRLRRPLRLPRPDPLQDRGHRVSRPHRAAATR